MNRETLARCAVNGCDTRLVVRLDAASGYGTDLRCSSCRRTQAHRFTNQDYSNRRPPRNANRSTKGS